MSYKSGDWLDELQLGGNLVPDELAKIKPISDGAYEEIKQLYLSNDHDDPSQATIDEVERVKSEIRAAKDAKFQAMGRTAQVDPWRDADIRLIDADSIGIGL